MEKDESQVEGNVYWNPPAQEGPKADDGRSYPGFRFYCTEENENAYGITTRSFWVKDAVYQDFIKEYFDGDPNRALGEEIMVSCDFNGKPNRLLPYSLFK